MMRKLLATAVLPALTLSLAASVHAQVGPAPVVLKVNGPSDNDRARVQDDGQLRKTDEEFTNEQGVVKFFAGGTRGLYVEMRSSDLQPVGSAPVPVPNPVDSGQPGRMQGACTPIALNQGADGTITLTELPGEKWISNNEANEYRAFNKPEIMTINGGKNMLLMYNWQPRFEEDGITENSDTRRYAKVLDQDCNDVPVYDSTGTLRDVVEIMAKEDDDCDMHQSGEGPCDHGGAAAGSDHLICWAGCNGNGADDGWANDISVTCQNDAGGQATSCTITKNFDISLAKREERSRGRCSVSDDDTSLAVCTWTEGNSQPQRDGVWIAGIDISPTGQVGDDPQTRILWKEQIDGTKELGSERKTYSVRAMHTRLLEQGPDGNLRRSSTLFFRSGDLEGRNRNNEKGGTYRGMQISALRATRDGVEYITPKTNANDMVIGFDSTHLTMCGVVFNLDGTIVPGFTLLNGSHNGGGVQEPQLKKIGYNSSTGEWIDLGNTSTGGSYDRHLYANFLGVNPGNQGRNFAGCTLLKNPFFGQNGSTVQYFVAHAMTGKAPSDVTDASLKPSSYVSLLAVADTASSSDGGGGGGSGSGSGSGSGGSPNQIGGCSSSRNAAGFLMLMAIALWVTRRPALARKELRQ
jgi:hypothetical protein